MLLLHRFEIFRICAEFQSSQQVPLRCRYEVYVKLYTIFWDALLQYHKIGNTENFS